jgi:hypothetical protein
MGHACWKLVRQGVCDCARNLLKARRNGRLAALMAEDDAQMKSVLWWIGFGLLLSFPWLVVLGERWLDADSVGATLNGGGGNAGCGMQDEEGRSCPGVDKPVSWSLIRGWLVLGNVDRTLAPLGRR